MTTWREMIKHEMSIHSDSFDNMIATTLKDGEMDVKFDAGYGGDLAIEFTLWTASRVYFPVIYDGAQWVGSVSRRPDGIATKHQGGG